MLPTKARQTNSDFEQECGLLVDGAQSVRTSTIASKTKLSFVVLVGAMAFIAISVRGVGHPPQGRVQAAVELNNIDEEAWSKAMTAAKDLSTLVKGKVKEVHKIGVKARAALKTWAEINGHKYSSLMTEYLDNMTSAESELVNVDSDFRGVLVFLSKTFGIALDQLEAKFANADKNTPVSIKGPKQMLSQAIDSALEDFKPMKLKFADLQKKFSAMANNTDILLAQCDGVISKLRRDGNEAEHETWMTALKGCVASAAAAAGGVGAAGVAAGGGAGAGAAAAVGGAAAAVGVGPLAAAGIIGGGGWAIVCAATHIQGAIEASSIADQVDGFVDKIRETKRLFDKIADKCDKLALYASRDYDNLNQINGKLKVEHWLISVASASMWRTTVVDTTRDTIKSINDVLLEGQ